MTTEVPEQEYEVGRGKPPKHTQFQKGRSGNPRGRPKGSRNHKTMLLEALGEVVLVTENGRQRKHTKQEIMFKQVVNKAAKGDHRSTELIIKRLDLFDQQAIQAAAQTSVDDDDTSYGTVEDDEVFSDFMARLQREQVP